MNSGVPSPLLDPRVPVLRPLAVRAGCARCSASTRTPCSRPAVVDGVPGGVQRRVYTGVHPPDQYTDPRLPPPPSSQLLRKVKKAEKTLFSGFSLLSQTLPENAQFPSLLFPKLLKNSKKTLFFTLFSDKTAQKCGLRRGHLRKP